MEDWAAREAIILEKLRKRIRDDPTFDDDEVEALKVLIKAYQGWAAFGWFPKWVIYTMAALAGAITAYKTILESVQWW